MSHPYQRRLSLIGIDPVQHDSATLKRWVAELMKLKIHGLSFSPYVEGQGPGTVLEEPQIRERLA